MASSSDARIRILLVDDHVVVRSGLRMLIESRPDYCVVGEAGNGAEALALAASGEPDVIVLDLDLGRENGLDLLPQILESAAHAQVLVLTGVQDPETHHRAVRLGALGIVSKDEASSVLLQAIERVFQGDAWLNRNLIGRVLKDLTRSRRMESQPDPVEVRIDTLTPREREVISLVGEGLKNKQIAGRLFISETTVRHHLTSIFAKLEVADRLELVLFALRRGLVEKLRVIDRRPRT